MFNAIQCATPSNPYSGSSSAALKYAPFASKYCNRRPKKGSLPTHSLSQTMQQCLLARVTATFMRLWSARNPISPASFDLTYDCAVD